MCRLTFSNISNALIFASLTHCLLPTVAHAGWTDFHRKKGIGCDDSHGVFHLDARGDFNGDSKMDRAVIQYDSARIRSRLVVFLDEKNAKLPIILREWNGSPDNEYVETTPPAKEETWCGKTDECAPGDPKVITYKYESIAFGSCESSRIVYYWDPKSHRFKNVGISD